MRRSNNGGSIVTTKSYHVSTKRILDGTKDIQHVRRLSSSLLQATATAEEEEGGKKSVGSSSSSKNKWWKGGFFSAGYLIALDVVFRRVLKRLAIGFPSSLAGCGTLFATFLLLCQVNEQWGDCAHSLLAPGAALLAKWLPVFFVPSLVTLPLAQSLGSTAEVLKVASVIIGGFFFTLLTTAFSVIGVRGLLKSEKDEAESSSSSDETATTAATATATTTTKVKKAFEDSTFNLLVGVTVGSALASVLAYAKGASQVLQTPLQMIYMLSVTLSTFVFGASKLPPKFTKVVHPLVTCTSLTWMGAKMMAMVTGQTFVQMLQSYKVGNLCPVHMGAGDILLFLLGPAVVALACQMYDRKTLMKQNLAEVGTAVTVSSVGGLFGTAALVRLLNIGNPMLRLSLLSRNITSPLAMAIAGILGGDVSLAVSMVVVTGLIGANFGASILDKFGITDAVARGLGIGAAAHGLGTAAFAKESDAFPFAAISMALTASACTVLVSIPIIKNLLMKIALGM